MSNIKLEMVLGRGPAFLTNHNNLDFTVKTSDDKQCRQNQLSTEDNINATNQTTSKMKARRIFSTKEGTCINLITSNETINL